MPLDWPDDAPLDLGQYLVCSGATDCAAKPIFFEMVFGHYGRDVVGIARVSGEEASPTVVKCPGLPPFPCTRIDTRYSDPNMAFDLYLCTGDARSPLRINVTRVSSDEIEIAFPSDSGLASLRMEKANDESELTSKDKDEAACEPRP